MSSFLQFKTQRKWKHGQFVKFLVSVRLNFFLYVFPPRRQGLTSIVLLSLILIDFKRNSCCYSIDLAWFQFSFFFKFATS